MPLSKSMVTIGASVLVLSVGYYAVQWRREEEATRRALQLAREHVERNYPDPCDVRCTGPQRLEKRRIQCFRYMRQESARIVACDLGRGGAAALLVKVTTHEGELVALSYGSRDFVEPSL